MVCCFGQICLPSGHHEAGARRRTTSSRPLFRGKLRPVKLFACVAKGQDVSVQPSKTTGTGHTIIKTASSISLAASVTRLLGYYREVAVASAFGISPVADAYRFAAIVPHTTVSNASVNGPIVSTLSPVLLPRPGADPSGTATRLAVALGVSGFLLCALLWTSSPAVLDVLAPGLLRSAEGQLTRDLALLQLRMMLPMTVCSGWLALAMAVLAARGSLLVPALSPAIASCSVLAAIHMRHMLPVSLAPTVYLRDSIAVAGGTMAGVVLQLLVVMATIVISRLDSCDSCHSQQCDQKEGQAAATADNSSDAGQTKAEPSLLSTLFPDATTWKTMWALLPALSASLLLQAAAGIDLAFASFVPGGASALGYAALLVNAPVGILSSSLLVALLPGLSKAVNTKQTSAAESTQAGPASSPSTPQSSEDSSARGVQPQATSLPEQEVGLSAQDALASMASDPGDALSTPILQRSVRSRGSQGKSTAVSSVGDISQRDIPAAKRAANDSVVAADIPVSHQVQVRSGWAGAGRQGSPGKQQAAPAATTAPSEEAQPESSSFASCDSAGDDESAQQAHTSTASASSVGHVSVQYAGGPHRNSSSVPEVPKEHSSTSDSEPDMRGGSAALNGTAAVSASADLAAQVGRAVVLSFRLVLPALAVLGALAGPAVDICYRRQQFDTAAASLVTSLVGLICITAPPFALRDLLLRVSYLTHDGTAAMAGGVVAVLTKLLFGWLLTIKLNLGLAGVVLSSSCASVIVAVLLFARLQNRLPGLAEHCQPQELAKYAAAALAAALACRGVYVWLADCVAGQMPLLPALAELLAGLLQSSWVQQIGLSATSVIVGVTLYAILVTW